MYQNWGGESKTLSAPLHWNDNHSGGILLSQALTFASSHWCPFTDAPQPTSLSGLQNSDGDGRPLQEALRWWRWRTDINHWKRIRCQSWWQQHLDPLRSSPLHRARGRPVGCHQQWGKCYLSSSWKAAQTIHMNADIFFLNIYKKHSLEQVGIQTLQDHFIPYRHNRNSLWQIKHVQIHWFFF